MKPLILLLILVTPAAANVPAAFFACEGADPGDPCNKPGPEYGACVLDTLCTDDPDTEVNECLLCVDPCWAGLEAGSFCVRFDGQDGICAPQDQCTTDPDKSFAQCNRCVRGDIARTEPGEGGCAATPGRARVIVPWLALLLVGALQLRRRRRR